jgi:hypothetical protein
MVLDSKFFVMGVNIRVILSMGRSKEVENISSIIMRKSIMEVLSMGMLKELAFYAILNKKHSIRANLSKA